MLRAAVLVALALVGCASPRPEVVRVERTRHAGCGWWKEREDLSVAQRESIIRSALVRFNEQEAIQALKAGHLSVVIPRDYRSFLLSPRLVRFNGDGSYVIAFECFTGDEDFAFKYLEGVIDALLLGLGGSR